MIRPQNVKDSLPQTLAQKIIARAAGKAEVEVGEIEIGSVDLAMIHDSGGPRRVAPILERLGVGLGSGKTGGGHRSLCPGF